MDLPQSRTPETVQTAWHGQPHEAGHRDMIDASHQRSRVFGLSDSDCPDFSSVPKRAFHAALEQNRFLYHHAAPVMETLYEQIANTHSMVLLTADNGLILHSLGDNDFLERASKVALLPGVEWSEQSKGTNAIGTALAEEQPVVVHGDDHFLRANQFLTCSCAPIIAPNGLVAGALDVTGDQRSYHHHTMALVRMSAQMIENHMYADFFPDAVRIHFHSRAEFLGTLVEGILVFSNDGRFLSANRSAQFQVGQSIKSLRAHTFSSLFGLAMSQFFDRLRGSAGKPLMLCLHSGVSVWCQSRLRPLSQWLGAGVDATGEGAGVPWTGAVGGTQRWEQPALTPTPPAQPEAPAAGARLSGLHYLDTGDPQLAQVLRKIERVSGRDIPIMILGETGTGKDLLAQAIHHDSDRSGKPFVSVNCASIPETLIESELFGYEEGAFTGARRRGAIGKLLQANGGTLFLDEIGDMPASLQARLLRVLQDRRVNPLGSSKAYETDFMLICATHRNIRDLIAQGSFREDLYYRLNGLVVRLPALRERTDFEVVTRRILSALCERGAPLEISPQVLEAFRGYDWPGNFRQLHNLLRTAVAMAGPEGRLEIEHLPEDFLDDIGQRQRLGDKTGGAPAAGSVVADSPHRLHDVTLQAMADTLRRHRGNVSTAAKALGVSRNTIYRKKSQLPGDVWG